MHAGHARSTWRNRNKGGNIITGKKLQRLLACLLAVLLLSQVGAFSPAVFAADDSSYTLQDGTAIIKSTMTTDEVNHALTRALVKDFDQLSPEDQQTLLDSLQWEYECEGKGKGLFGFPVTRTDWGSINGFTSVDKKINYTHPALKYNKDGSYQVRVADTTAEVTLTKAEKLSSPITLKQGVTEVAMVYNKDQSINYEETAQALREALLVSADPNVSINDVTVEYNAGIAGYKPLDCNETLVPKFKLGTQTIRFTWRGNADYQAYTAEVTVEMTDSRIVSEVALKTGASITYNMDANVMLQAILDNLVDWDASKLPEKSTLTLDDFTIEYYAENELEIDGMTIGGKVHLYMPIEGGMGGAYEGDLVKSLTYPQMGAGEQQIRVTFNGDEAYRSSTPIEGDLTVNKAKVSVKVHSTSIYADEAKDKLGDGFVTTDPADKFDIYTIYGGMTSDVTTSVFVQLPERYTNTALIKVIDWALEQAGQPTLTEMMNNGITVGQLRKILSDVISSGADMPQFIKDALKKANIDIDTLVKLNDALNKLPGLLDNVRVAFGTPDQAGIYTVCAVTNNKNYETGFGMGALVVKKHYSGVKLTWNQNFTNGKISAAEAANFDFKATLSYNGNSDISQDNVHYLYSGFTSKWRPYSSTTTPPTEPGRYVVTVVTLGGNYQAAPITRAFQITK